MVLTGPPRRRAATPAFVVPDEQFWTVLGHDPMAAGLEPVADIGRTRHLLLPDPVPEALASAVVRCVDELPLGVTPEPRAVSELPGRSLAAVLDQAAAELSHAPQDDHHAHEGHDQHAGHEDHGDMMAITGEPSADGLVMEPIELSLGPLGTPLPGGLVVDVVLDGDVVAGCTVRATLRQTTASLEDPPAPPDLLAPVAWSCALATEVEASGRLEVTPSQRWLRLAAVEVERAVSHLAWLRAFARLLGWPRLVEQIAAALEPLPTARAALPIAPAAPDLAEMGAGPAVAALSEAGIRTQRLARFCERARRLAVRTSGRGLVAERDGLTGPTVRACGVSSDSRVHDPLYGELGFVPVTRDGGDAHARTLLRLDEACRSIAHARDALERAVGGAAAPDATHSPAGTTLEGPRGPVHAQRMPREWRLSAPGAHPLLSVAGESAEGLEWASALVVLASFDLSPWSVGA